MDWLSPTRAVVRWSPLLAASALAAATLVLIRVLDRPMPSQTLIVAPAMMVVGAVCGLHDPGRDFVHALPVSAAQRLAHRLIVLVPPLVLALFVVRWLAASLFATLPPSPGWKALAAFGAAGVATCATLARRLGTRAADAAVSAMLVWLVCAVSRGLLDLGVDLDGVLMPWWRWPLLVTSIAAFVTVVATTRGVEA